MKRKLISYDVFESIQNGSLSKAEFELIEAEPILSKALQTEGLKLHSFGSDSAFYESLDGTYVKADFKFNRNKIEFSNIEQVAIDESTEKAKSKELLTSMLDAVLETNTEKAESFLKDYLSLPVVRRGLKESVLEKKDKKKGKKPFPFMKKDKDCVKVHMKKGGKKKIHEWARIVENALSFIDYKQFGPVYKESVINHDDTGNVVAVKIPTLQARNEAKLLSFNWKTLDTDVKVLRSGAQNLSEDNAFVSAVAELKRHNAVSDNEALEQSLESIVQKWPGTLYLTQTELANTIKESLESVDAKNYDDQTCEFMAEGILRTAHNAYVDRVHKIMTLAGVTENAAAIDAYADFKTAVDKFYPTLSESNVLEMQMYVDLYESLRQLYSMAVEDKDQKTKQETALHLEELSAIIEKEVAPDLSIAQAAAAWLNHVVETNLEMSSWEEYEPHTTINGDNPKMGKNANVSYTPSKDFSGDYGDPAPVSDGKKVSAADAEEMRNKSWGNIGGKDIYPSLDNPYVPKSEIPKITEKDADTDPNGEDGGKDTWPSLENPYVPTAVMPKPVK